MDINADPIPPHIDEAAEEFFPSEAFDEALANTSELLTYAAEQGITIPDNVTAPLVEALIKRRLKRPFQHHDIMEFFDSLTILALNLRPVTARTIRESKSANVQQRLRTDRKRAVRWTLAALLLSALAFVCDDFNTRITADIGTGDVLAANIRARLAGPFDQEEIGDPCSQVVHKPKQDQGGLVAEQVRDLQQFAENVRRLGKEASKFNVLLFYSEDQKPLMSMSDDMELNPSIVNPRAEALCQIRVFQRARDLATNVQLDVAHTWGMVWKYFLPVVFAMVGAYAYRLRSFSEAVAKQTYLPSKADDARLLGAFIIGSVVSFFKVFGQDGSLPPVAIAFLAGYAVEVFYAVLDAVVQVVAKRDGAPAPTSSTSVVRTGNSQSSRKVP